MSFVEDSLRRTAGELFAPDGTTVPLSEFFELGWEELLADEPVAAVSTMAEEQGRHRASSRLVEFELSRCLGLEPRVEALAFVLGGLASPSPSIDIVLIADADLATSVVVPVDIGHIALCRVPVADLQTSPVDGIDADAQWTRLSGDIDITAGTPVDAGIWSHAVASGRLALAHELIGSIRGMLDLAVAHVTDRKQFGVPIGTFQAVQHRLAEVHVQMEAARAITRTVWVDGDPLVSAAALLAARDAVEVATEHCHQVMGAIGCTWEHDLHRLIRRGILLSLLLPVGDDTRDAMVIAAASTRRTEVLA